MQNCKIFICRLRKTDMFNVENFLLEIKSNKQYFEYF